jgi:predicted small secreted protein
MYKKNLLLVLVLVLAVGLSGCLSFLKPEPKELEVKPAAVEIEVGNSQKLTVTVKDEKGKEIKKIDGKDIKWVIEDKVVEPLEENDEEAEPVAVLSANTGKEVTVTGKKVGEAVITVSYNDIVNEVDVTVKEATEDPGDDEEEEDNILLAEKFEAADKDTFFSTDYKKLTEDSNMPFYHITGGGSGITVENGKLVLSGARFTAGMPNDHENTASDKTANGVLDLSKPYKIRIEYSDPGTFEDSEGNVPELSAKKFFVYLDNNTTSSGNTQHSFDSRIIQLSMEQLKNQVDSETSIGVIEVEPNLGTETSFLQFRTESNSSVTLLRITVEYIEE